MNNVRRNKIHKLIKELEKIETSFDSSILSGCMSVLEDIKNNEEEAFDNMPEGLQYSSRGMDSEAAIENLDEALEYLKEIDEIEDMEEIKTNISMAIDCLEDATV